MPVIYTLLGIWKWCPPFNLIDIQSIAMPEMVPPLSKWIPLDPAKVLRNNMGCIGECFGAVLQEDPDYDARIWLFLEWKHKLRWLGHSLFHP